MFWVAISEDSMTTCVTRILRKGSNNEITVRILVVRPKYRQHKVVDIDVHLCRAFDEQSVFLSWITFQSFVGDLGAFLFAYLLYPAQPTVVYKIKKNYSRLATVLILL